MQRETQMDLEPGTLEQELGTGEDARLYENNEGAQTGGTRSLAARTASQREAQHGTRCAEPLKATRPAAQ